VSVRKLLERSITTDADLDSFCLDYFPKAKRRFSSGMERTQKINLLLELESNLGRIAEKVNERFACGQASEQYISDSSLKSQSANCLCGYHELVERPLLVVHDQEARNFSPRIKLALAEKIIHALTEEQYRIIEYLRGHRRVAIAGCAGSGKTLVAIEKAIRLSRAGIRTMVICHNPYLADYLRKLAQGTGVVIADFTDWIRQLNDNSGDISDLWSILDEPTNEEITNARYRLAQSRNKFGAIIVDEGQDFRESWWQIVEEALEYPDTGYLYVFYDDNQALLPHRGRAPISVAPFNLSRNCRNAGRIFELIQRFHEAAPAPTADLIEHGTAKIYRYNEENKIETAISAIRAAIQVLNSNRIVVLTTEQAPITESVLNGVKIDIPHPWSWQDAVTRYLSSVVRPTRLQGDRFSRPMKIPRHAIWSEYAAPIPTLSASLIPTAQDVYMISSWAREAHRSLQLLDDHPRGAPPRWGVISNRLQLSGRATPARLLSFFSSENWAQGIPAPSSVFVFDRQNHVQISNSIPIHKVSDFKGLEMDGIILFDPTRLARNSLTYVGISRAKFLLFSIIPA